MNRVNEEAVAEAITDVMTQNKLKESWESAGEPIAFGDWAEKHDTRVITCDYCSEPAETAIPIYNPADEVRGVEGAYAMTYRCHQCDENHGDPEETFRCAGCGELFITHHSWDVLYVTLDDSMLCQACAAARLEPVSVSRLLRALKMGNIASWHRINNIPGKELIWEGEFSEYSDFPGHQNLSTVCKEIAEAAKEAGLCKNDLVYPAVTHGYQFSVVLGVFH